MAKWSPAAKATVLAAVISTLAIIATAYWQQQHGQPKPLVFTGQVESDTNQVLPNATVLAFFDNNVGQTTRTDSNGQFELQVPADVKSLRLTINAAGFGQAKIQADIHRTGPEEIQLHPLAKPTDENRPANPLPKEPAHRAARNSDSKPATHSDAPLVPSPSVNAGIINNAPNQGLQNICAPGVGTCDQSIHIGKEDSPPEIGFYSRPIPAQDRDQRPPAGSREQGYARFNAGAELEIAFSKPVTSPTVLVNCREGCFVGIASQVRRSGDRFSAINAEIADEASTADGRHHRLTVVGNFAQRTMLELIVRSTDDKTPDVVSVQIAPDQN